MPDIGETQVSGEELGLEVGEKAREDAAAMGEAAFPVLLWPGPPLLKRGNCHRGSSLEVAATCAPTVKCGPALAHAHGDPASGPGTRVQREDLPSVRAHTDTGGGGAYSLGGPGLG